MQTYEVDLTPDAISDLNDIYKHIKDKSGFPKVAWAYIEKLKKACEGLQTAPIRGQKRDDLRKNLRIYPIEKNAVVAFEVDEKSYTVTILNIFYGGEDYEAIMGGS